MKCLICVSLLFLMFSCGRTPATPTFRNSEIIAQKLIQICIDSTLRLDSGWNTNNYLVDFKLVKELNKKGIHRFLNRRNEFQETNLDSLIRLNRKISKLHFILPAVAVRFEKITVRSDGLVLVEMSKTGSADTFIGVELLLKPEGNSFRCLRSEMTYIS